MALTLNDLTVSPEGLDREAFLQSWDWAFDKPALPVVMTAMGDVFAQDSEGAVYFLDTCQGKVERVADDGVEFQGLLGNAKFVTAFFHPATILELRNQGLALEKGQCYSHKKPLVLGGEDKPENIEVTDVSVHVDLMGQIHKQVRDVPPGTPINISLEGA